MKDFLSILGRGLIVAAMCSLVACGDDSGDDGEAGSGGSTAGSGGSTAGSGGGGGGGGGGVDACVAAAETASPMWSAGASDECKTCVCTACDEATVSACDDVCWGLITCVGANCAGLDQTGTTSCAIMMCGDFIGASTQATAVGDCAYAGDASDCTDACSDGSTPDTDAGGDAG